MAAAKKIAPRNNSSRGLGKGLSALMSDSYSQTSNESPQNINAVNENALGPKQVLDLDKIQSGKYQPRGNFNSDSLAELADSIRKNGVMQPILVRELSDDRYEIIAGERRWRAAKLAGLNEIPVLIREMENEQALEIAIVENIQREDLHPLEEAAGYQRLMDEFGYTQENLATTVHKSRSHIANLLRLLALPEDIRLLLTENKITMGHAKALLGAEEEDFSRLAEQVVRKGLNVRQTEKLVNNSKKWDILKPARKKREPKASNIHSFPTNNNAAKDPDILALEETLSENLGLKVSINDRGQSGEIMIAYESLEQLDEILRRLGGSI